MMRTASPFPDFCLSLVLLALASTLLSGCRLRSPSISFTQVPAASPGGADSQGVISGRVIGSRPGAHLLLYANPDGRWWVQPLSNAPYTEIAPDGTWSASIHMGMDYAALLTTSNEQQETVITRLPKINKEILAVASAHGTPNTLPKNAAPAKIIRFGGYDWELRTGSGAYGGKNHYYLPDNVWLGPDGAMHLRVTQIDGQWVCAEAHITRTLGYGTYRWRIRDAGHLEPAAMLSMFTWAEPFEEHHREIDLHVSQWGDPESKNGEYVIQPYYLPANVYRFSLSPGPLDASFQWTEGRVLFSTHSRTSSLGKQKPQESWTFTSGVPSSNDEKTSVNLCEFGYAKRPLQHETEVVIEQFEFLP